MSAVSKIITPKHLETHSVGKLIEAYETALAANLSDMGTDGNSNDDSRREIQKIQDSLTNLKAIYRTAQDPMTEMETINIKGLPRHVLKFLQVEHCA